MEIIIPDTLNLSDPHTAPRLPVYSSDSRHLQSEDSAGAVNTQILMSEIEAIPEILAIGEKNESHEVNPTEEVLIDVKDDPLKEKGIEMEYVEDPGQVEQDNTQDIRVNSLTENSNNPPRQEKHVKDKQSGELKPYSFYVNDKIDISTHKGEKPKAPVNVQTVQGG